MTAWKVYFTSAGYSGAVVATKIMIRFENYLVELLVLAFGTVAILIRPSDQTFGLSQASSELYSGTFRRCFLRVIISRVLISAIAILSSGNTLAATGS